MEQRDRAVGPENPCTATPPAPRGGIRRTSSIDTRRPTDADPVRRVDARARDRRAHRDGTGEVLDTATLTVAVAPVGFAIAALTTAPADPRLDALVGLPVGPGYRRHLAGVLDDDHRGSLVALLLDDLAGAQLVAGYDTVSATPDATRADPDRAATLLARADLCAGWVDGGTLIRGIRRTSQVPLHVGPPAPVLESPDDPDGGHAMAPLTPGSMRRRRRLDLHPAADGHHRFEAHFRDSHASDHDGETILHEYLVRGSVAATSRTIVEIDAEARVLPYPECPGALAGAPRMVGEAIGDLRRSVNRELTGTGACTHLNDVLRSLADLDALLDHLALA